MFEALFSTFFILIIAGHLLAPAREDAKKPALKAPARSDQSTLINSTSKIKAEFGGIL